MTTTSIDCRQTAGSGDRGGRAPTGAAHIALEPVLRNAARRILLAVGLSASLAGCGLSTLTSGLGSSVFGGNSNAQTTGSTKVSETDLLAAARGPGTYSGTLGEVSSQCPRVRVEARDNNLTVYAPGLSGDGLSVMHRGELTKTARECRVAGGSVTVKYGFSGRVLLGPKGHSGTIVLPLKVSLLNSKRERLSSETVNVETAATVEKPIGYFSTVRTLSFQMPVGSRPGEFEIEIGFERAGQPAPLSTAPLATRRPLMSGGRL